MKIDLTYPKISDSNTGLLTKCIAFEKIDGTNMHWVWDLSDGWSQFGTRRTQFPLTTDGIQKFNWKHSELHNAPHFFNEKLRDKLTAYLALHPVYSLGKITVFTEFHGPGSFAGSHHSYDQTHRLQKLTLIDVAVGNKIISPQQFIDDFSQFGIAKVVYTGNHIGQLVQDVYRGKYDVVEGIVCKGELRGDVHMFKAKTREWLKKLEKR